MILPSMPYRDGIRKQEQVKFGGLNHTVGAEDGELWDMRNLTSDDYPVLSVRPRRQLIRTLEKPNGLFYWKGLMWVDGTDVYYDGVLVGRVEDSKKHFGALGPYITVWPDKMCYHVETGAFEALEVSWEQGTETVRKGSYDGGLFSAYGADGICAEVESDVSVEPPIPEDLFRVGDAVVIYGLTSGGEALEDGFTAIIQRIYVASGVSTSGVFWARTFLRFYDDALSGVAIGGNVRIVRKVPEFVQVCEDGNRLWGCDGDTIYASKLGDPFNWNVYDGLDTDSWTVTPGSSGEFTGCINFQGYPTFFKEDRMYKVYGSLPSDFQTVDTPCLGVARDGAGTLTAVGDILFYLGSNGPMAYTGSIPQPIGEALGSVRFTRGRAGSDGLKYYACLEASSGLQAMYVYDVQRGLWHIEDETEAVDFCRTDGDLYRLGADGRIHILGSAKAAPEDADEEDAVEWMAEFSDFTEEDPNHKGLGKLQLRLQLEEGSRVCVLIQFDSDGVWRNVRTLTGLWGKRNYYLPIVPRRCDHYRLKLEGEGGCRIFSLVRETYSGSERNARG